MSGTNHVIVIGTGAAGVLATVTAAGEDAAVELWEQNKGPDRKLFVTGKGRYSVTDVCDAEELLSSVVSNSKFLYGSFYGSTNRDMVDLLEQAGFRLKMEWGNRVFPQPDKSLDVISALSALLRQAGVRVCLNQKTERLAMKEDMCKRAWRGGGIQTTDCVIAATGGLFYPTTSSTGGGLKWVADSGHGFTGLSPALVPFEMKEMETVRELQSLSLKNIKAAVYGGEKELYWKFGEMLFTHFGVSGPVFLNVSSFYVEAVRERSLRLVIDLKPTLPWEQLGERILRDLSDSRDKQSKSALNHPYPSKLIPVIIDCNSMDPGKEMNEIIREERRGLTEATKALEFILTGFRDYKEAIIAQSGISIKDVNSSTIESKKIQDLYSTEEILDLDAVTGGSNLQIAWSAGQVAGKATSSQRRERRRLPAGRNT